MVPKRLPLFFVLILVFRRKVLIKNVSFISGARAFLLTVLPQKDFVKALPFWETMYHLTGKKDKKKNYIADKMQALTNPHWYSQHKSKISL